MEALGLLAFLAFLSMPIMLIVSLVKLSDVQEQIAALRLRLTRGEKTAGLSPVRDAQVETPAAETPAVESVAATKQQVASAPVPMPEPAPEAEPEPTPVPAVAAAAEPQPQPVAPEARPAAPYAPTALDLFWMKVEDWFCVRGDFAPKGMTHEFACATRWLVRVGILLIVSSLAYFVKLSIDRGWMGPTGRVVMILSCGIVGVVGGVALVRRTRYALIGHAVVALGIVALYFGFGLGHRFFDPPVIASASLAFAALFAVTVCAGVLAVTLRAPVIAVLGLLGGYLVPLIAGRDTGSPVGLDGYLIVLNLGAFVVARYRKWSALDFLASLAGYLFGFAWCEMHPGFGKSALIVSLIFLSLVNLVYMASVLADTKSRSPAGKVLAWVGLSFGACIYFAWLAAFFGSTFAKGAVGLALFAVAAVYGCAAMLARRRGWTDPVTASILQCFALGFLTLVPPYLLGTMWWSCAWCVLAIVTFEAACRTGERVLEGIAYLILAVAGGLCILHVGPQTYLQAWTHPSATFLGYVVGSLSRLLRLGALPAALAWISCRRAPSGLTGNAEFVRGLRLAAGLLVFIAYTCEARAFGIAVVPALKSGMVTLAWTVAAFAGIWLGIVRQLRFPRLAALALLFVSAAKLLIIDTAHLATPARVGLSAAVGVTFIVGAFLYIRFKDQFEEKED